MTTEETRAAILARHARSEELRQESDARRTLDDALADADAWHEAETAAARKPRLELRDWSNDAI